MSEFVYVLLPDGRCLGLEREELERALARGREFMPEEPSGVQKTEALEDAHRMEELSGGVPATWWLEMARRGKVRHRKLGKYVRFKPSEALESEALETRKKEIRPGSGRAAEGFRCRPSLSSGTKVKRKNGRTKQ